MPMIAVITWTLSSRRSVAPSTTRLCLPGGGVTPGRGAAAAGSTALCISGIWRGHPQPGRTHPSAAGPGRCAARRMVRRLRRRCGVGRLDIGANDADGVFSHAGMT